MLEEKPVEKIESVELIKTTETENIESIECVEEVKKDSYDIMDLNPYHQRFIHLYLTGSYKIKDIASLLGVTPITIGKWLKREDISSIIAQFQEDEFKVVSTTLKNLAAKAVDKLSDLIDSPNEQISFAASKDVLDRTGHKAVQQVKMEKTVNFESKLQELADKTIDVEYEIVED